MVSVRRVAPLLLLAVTIPVFAQAPAPAKSPQKKTSKTAAPAQPAPPTTATTATTSTAGAMTTTATTTTTSSKTKKTAKRATKKAAPKAAEKPAEKRATKPAAKTAAKSTHPPRELHKVGDHWTPYNPPDPSTYPPDAKTYTIKQGDTLWALGQQFYNNAYLWPQIWEANTWITDAHWIYPGDVLLIQGEIAQQAQGAGAPGTGTTVGGGPTTTTGGAEAGQPGGIGTPLGTPRTTRYITAAEAVGGTTGPVALATEYDIYCYGYIGDPDEPMPNHLSGWEDVEVRYQPGATRQEIDGSQGDLVFIDGGTSTGLNAGDTYVLVLPQDLVTHPATHDVVGRQYEYRGQVRVLCADATTARGIITQSCAEIPLGSRLKPLPQIPIPLARVPSLPAFCDPASGKTNGYIVTSQGGDWLESLGVGQLVQINLGRDDQVQPGEFLTVFRDEGFIGTPRQVLGELAVLTTESHTATAKIVLMRRSMRVGDRVEIR
jgi:LysM repeat protein